VYNASVNFPPRRQTPAPAHCGAAPVFYVTLVGSDTILEVKAGQKVRVRFAPSPTGQVHVGNARTALVNWLFARQKGGAMVLRIEDTDVERSEARYEQQILDDLKWLGLDWDEGPGAGGPFAPYRQSDRLELYRTQAERLLDEGKAYLCFCGDEELRQEHDRAVAEQRSAIYSGKCRRLDAADARRRRAAGEHCAIRLRIPEHPIRFHDLVRGTVEFPNEVISDPIILCSSGVPVYNFVVVVDDALMEITHVIRGDDHLSNTPKQVALYEALGWAALSWAPTGRVCRSATAPSPSPISANPECCRKRW
jgi:nondiscriminating glutamyl-tRNA synthetase